MSSIFSTSLIGLLGLYDAELINLLRYFSIVLSQGCVQHRPLFFLFLSFSLRNRLITTLFGAVSGRPFDFKESFCRGGIERLSAVAKLFHFNNGGPKWIAAIRWPGARAACLSHILGRAQTTSRQSAPSASALPAATAQPLK